MTTALSTQKKEGSLTALLRKVRPYLPGVVKKISPTVYEVENCIRVEFNYYCSWTAGQKQETKEEKAKTCYPSSITVSVCRLKDAGITFSNRSVYRTRTFNKSKNSEYALESIATCVTKGIEAVDLYIAAHIAYKQQQEQERTQEEEEYTKLEKLLPGFTQRYSRGSFCIYGPDETLLCDVGVDLEKDDDRKLTGKVIYSITGHKVTLEQLQAIVTLIQTKD